MSLRLVSLFSGCGGMDLGFVEAGFDCVWANDIDNYARMVYERNLGFIDGRSICAIDVSEIPDCDILVGGFPCQPFSSAGSRRGLQDVRGALYRECLRVIEAKLPSVVVLENVRGLLTSYVSSHCSVLDAIESDLTAIGVHGYTVFWRVLNASDYGVPQHRERLFIVGVRSDIVHAFAFPSKMCSEGLTLGVALDIPALVPDQVVKGLSASVLAMVAHIPEGGSWHDVPYEYLLPRLQTMRDNLKAYGSPVLYRRFGRNEICGTITASATPEKCGILHPVENRCFTVREVARIQSFPDTFSFCSATIDSVSALYRMVGNAVPPRLAYALAVCLLDRVF